MAVPALSASLETGRDIGVKASSNSPFTLVHGFRKQLGLGKLGKYKSGRVTKLDICCEWPQHHVLTDNTISRL